MQEENKEKNKLITTTSPHIFKDISTQKIMWLVVIALFPAIIASIYFFGIDALLVILASVISALLTEIIIQKLSKKELTINDGSAVITGLLLALVLPPTVPLWTAALGSIFAITIAKHAFGGLGFNIFNPALAGRAFIIASWPALVSKYITPDSITSATPLTILKLQGQEALIQTFGTTSALYHKLFVGNIGGCIGETSALALLFGVAFLFYKKIIDWRIPALYIGTVFILSLIFGQNPIIAVLAGGLLIGAFFMATDPVTSPTTKNGRLIFGFGCGFLTIIIRIFSGLPEGVMYSILLMNAFTPLIDRYTIPKPFGTPKGENKIKLFIDKLRRKNE